MTEPEKSEADELEFAGDITARAFFAKYGRGQLRDVKTTVYGDPPTHSITEVSRFGHVAICKARLGMSLVKRLDHLRTVATPDRLFIVATSGFDERAIIYAHQQKIRLYCPRRVQRYKEDNYTIKWTEKTFEVTPEVAKVRVNVGGEINSALSLIVSEFGRPPENLDQLGRRLARDYGPGLNDMDMFAYEPPQGAKAALPDHDAPCAIDEVTFHVEQKSSTPVTLKLPSDNLYRWSLEAIDGRSESLDIDMSMNAVVAADRSPRGFICASCWKRSPTIDAYRHKVEDEFVRGHFLLEQAPCQSVGDVLVCRPCHDAINVRDRRYMSYARFNVEIAVANVDMFRMIGPAFHLKAVHAGLLRDNAVYRDSILPAPAFSSNIDDCIRFVSDGAKLYSTADLRAAITPALNVRTSESAARYGLSSPWAEWEFLSEVLASVEEPAEPQPFPLEGYWQLRLALESVVEAHVQVLGFDPEERTERSDDSNALLRLYVDRYLSAPQGTLRHLTELLFNLVTCNPEAAAEAFPGLKGDAIFRVLMIWLYDLGKHALKDGLACLGWALGTFSAAKRDEYQRLSPDYILASFEVNPADENVLGNLLTTERGSRNKEFARFDAERQTRMAPIIKDSGGYHPAPFRMYLHAMILRINKVLNKRASYGRRKGLFYERLALASISAFKQLTLRHSLIIKRGTGIAEQDILAIGKRVVLCIEIKAHNPKQLERRRGDALLRLTESFQSTAGEALEQAERLGAHLKAGKVDGLELPVNPEFVHVALTLDNFGNYALKPKRAYPKLEGNAIITSLAEFERLADFFLHKGLGGDRFAEFFLAASSSDYSEVVEELSDLALAYVDCRGRLPAPTDPIWKLYHGKGCDFLDEEYEHYFSRVCELPDEYREGRRNPAEMDGT